MTWITGTATDFKDLLDQVRSNAVSEGWTEERYTTGGAAPHTDELILQGPGFGTGYEVYFGIRTYEDSINNYRCWDILGYTSFDSGRIFDQQLGVSPAPVVMRLWDATITFWMSISDRRIVLIAKCSNTYHSMYAGFIDPFSDPIEYPYPMYVGSDAASYGTFGNTDSEVRAMCFPGNEAAYLREGSGVWRVVANYSGDGLNGWAGFSPGEYVIWPYAAPAGIVTGSTNADYGKPNYAQFELIPGTTDTLPMINTYVTAHFDGGGILGVLEGVMWIPGNTLSAEQELTVGGDTYQVFIAISRSLESPSQFYAIKEA